MPFVCKHFVCLSQCDGAVRRLLSSTAVLYHVNGQLQRAQNLVPRVLALAPH